MTSHHRTSLKSIVILYEKIYKYFPTNINNLSNTIVGKPCLALIIQKSNK